jgi:MYXO-CTERM domain-containing protein
VLPALSAELLMPGAPSPDPDRPRLATTAVRVDPESTFGVGLLLAGVLMVLVGLRRRRCP